MCADVVCVLPGERQLCHEVEKHYKNKKGFVYFILLLNWSKTHVTNDIPYDKILFILFMNTHTHTVFVLH